MTSWLSCTLIQERIRSPRMSREYQMFGVYNLFLAGYTGRFMRTRKPPKRTMSSESSGHKSSGKVRMKFDTRTAHELSSRNLCRIFGFRFTRTIVEVHSVLALDVAPLLFEPLLSEFCGRGTNIKLTL